MYARPLHVLISGGREGVDVGENSRSRIFVTARPDPFHFHPSGQVSKVKLSLSLSCVVWCRCHTTNYLVCLFVDSSVVGAKDTAPSWLTKCSPSRRAWSAMATPVSPSMSTFLFSQHQLYLQNDIALFSHCSLNRLCSEPNAEKVELYVTISLNKSVVWWGK